MTDEIREEYFVDWSYDFKTGAQSHTEATNRIRADGDYLCAECHTSFTEAKPVTDGVSWRLVCVCGRVLMTRSGGPP